MSGNCCFRVVVYVYHEVVMLLWKGDIAIKVFLELTKLYEIFIIGNRDSVISMSSVNDVIRCKCTWGCISVE